MIRKSDHILNNTVCEKSQAVLFYFASDFAVLENVPFAAIFLCYSYNGT